MLPNTKPSSKSQSQASPDDEKKAKQESLLSTFKKYKNLQARVLTTYGEFVIKLLPQTAPIAVDNFIQLAEGTKTFLEFVDGEANEVQRPFYEGLMIHRISPNFIVQMGCPIGNGTGGPGYTLPIEDSDLVRFDGKGVVAMANREGKADGSQFFITLGPAMFIKEPHSIFGKVTEGMDIVEKIAKVPTLPNEKPTKKVLISSIKIERSTR